VKIIGITGPTGAGKTTALHALEELGGRIVDCDAIYHRLLESDKALQTELAERFGAEILSDGGDIDRKRLGAIVFANPAALEALNRITHPYIRRAIAQEAERGAEEGQPALAVDAIALIESGIGGDCDTVVGVLAPKELRIRRIMSREGISEAYARSRVEAQQGDAFFRAHCDYILDNDESLGRAAFAGRARELFRQILLPEKGE